MKKPILFLTTLLLMTSCKSAISQLATSTTSANIYDPSPVDSKLTTEPVFLDSVILLTDGRTPVQYSLVLKGNLPTPCNKLRIKAHMADKEKKIILDVYSVIDPNTICTQVIDPFQANFPLGILPNGHFTIWVNGKQVADFRS